MSSYALRLRSGRQQHTPPNIVFAGALKSRKTTAMMPGPITAFSCLHQKTLAPHHQFRHCGLLSRPCTARDLLRHYGASRVEHICQTDARPLALRAPGRDVDKSNAKG